MLVVTLELAFDELRIVFRHNIFIGHHIDIVVECIVTSIDHGILGRSVSASFVIPCAAGKDSASNACRGFIPPAVSRCRHEKAGLVCRSVQNRNIGQALQGARAEVSEPNE